MSGLLEVCVRERWGTVCDRDWTTSNTKVVCRQLGHSIRGWCGRGREGGRNEAGRRVGKEGGREGAKGGSEG